MKRWIVTAICIIAASGAVAQVYVTRTGTVNFFSKTPLEDIKAENGQVYAAVDLSKKNDRFFDVAQKLSLPQGVDAGAF